MHIIWSKSDTVNVVKHQACHFANNRQETHHQEMRIPERDVTYIVLYVYLLIYAYNNNNNNNNNNANLLRVGV